MTKKLQLLRRLAIRFRHEERGAVLVLVAVLALGLAAIASFVVDYGRVMNAQKELQAAADAAALAAAQELPDGSAAANTALSYGATAGGKNTRPDLPNVVTSPDAKCLNYLQQLMQQRNCVVGDPPNAIKVDQDAEVKLVFLGGLGIPGIHVHATALASMKGGTAYPLDIAIALDRTGSMGGSAGGGLDKIDRARLGVQAFLGAMRPSSDRIGLVLYPPTNSTSCNFSVGNNPYENAQAGYRAVHLRSDFRTSDTGGLNYSSPLVQAVGGSHPTSSSCPDVDGFTAYTTAFQQAKNELVANGRSNAQDVIIFFTDGEANYGPYIGSAPNNNNERRHPCQSAIDLATTLKAGAPPPGEPPPFVAGTWVYSVLYSTEPDTRCFAAIPKPSNWDQQHPRGPAWNCMPPQPNVVFPDNSPSSTWRDGQGGYYCNELPHLTAQHTLQSMASVGTDGQPRFYTSDDDLTDIFKRIAIDLSATRLLPDDTQ